MSSTYYHRILLALSICLLTIFYAACSQLTSTTTIPAPTATAQPTLIPRATMTPTPSAKLTLVITCSGTKQGGYGVDVEHGKVCARTLPGAALNIQVTYCNGKADPSSVLQGQVLADATGFYQWNWTPQPDCKGQPIWSSRVEVTAHLGGQTITASLAAQA